MVADNKRRVFPNGFLGQMFMDPTDLYDRELLKKYPFSKESMEYIKAQSNTEIELMDTEQYFQWYKNTMGRMVG